MNLPQRTILSLIVSIILFAAFSLLAFTGLFGVVEARFYSPRVVTSLDREVEGFAQTIGTLLGDLRDRFADTLENEAVKRSFLPDQKADDTFERSRLFGLLANSLPGLRTVRFVDAGGSRIHFSTLSDDVLAQTGSSLSYRSYRDCPGVLPYREVETEEGQPFRIIFDDSDEQLIFSYPFSDSLDVYRGSALFTFSVRAITERLIRQGQIKPGEDPVLVNSPNGFLFGLPAAETGNLKYEAAAAWQENILTFSVPDYAEVEPLALISARSDVGFFVGRLVQEDVLVLPPVMRFILLASFFLTLFLAIFLLFSLRQDSVAVIRSRLKQLQISLIRQYYDTKDDIDWKRWNRELEQRRKDIRLEIKRGLPRGKSDGDIDALIDRSWDELIAFAGSRLPAEFDEEKVRALVGKMIQEAAPGMFTQNSAEESASAPPPLEAAAGPEELEELAVVEDPVEEPEALELSGTSEEFEEMAGPEEPEEAEVLEEIDEEKSQGEIIVTPETFENRDDGETVTELESPEPASVPVTPEALAVLASRIEFGPDSPSAIDALSIPDDNTELPLAEGKTVMEMDLSSPFESLSFESPDFSGFDGSRAPESEKPGKKRQHGEGLEEITEDGGLPLICRPFQFRGNDKPILLRPLADEEGEGEPIREQDGVHLISSDILDPTLETTRSLDPAFLSLVESIIGRDSHG
jgi:hypothetical protein